MNAKEESWINEIAFRVYRHFDEVSRQDVKNLVERCRSQHARIERLEAALSKCQIRLTRLAVQRNDPSIWAEPEMIEVNEILVGVRK